MLSTARPTLARTAVRAISTTRPSADLAKFILIGRVGNAPVIKENKNGKPYAIYSVATNDPVRKPAEGEPYPDGTTSWHTIFATGPRSVEIASNLEAGSLVWVEANFTVENKKQEDGTYKTTHYAHQDKVKVIKKAAPKATVD